MRLPLATPRVTERASSSAMGLPIAQISVPTPTVDCFGPQTRVSAARHLQERRVAAGVDAHDLGRELESGLEAEDWLLLRADHVRRRQDVAVVGHDRTGPLPDPTTTTTTASWARGRSTGSVSARSRSSA